MVPEWRATLNCAAMCSLLVLSSTSDGRDRIEECDSLTCTGEMRCVMRGQSGSAVCLCSKTLRPPDPQGMCDVTLSDETDVRVHALEGAVGLLECPVFVYGSGQRVMWTKQRVDVTKLSTRLSVSQRSGALRIQRAQFMDSGHYTCTVRGDNTTASRDIILHVVSYPKITSVRNASAAQGGEAFLQCKVESTPASTIKWERLDGPLARNNILQGHRPEAEDGVVPIVHTSTSEGTPSVTVSELRFRSVQPWQAGLYLCMATNTPGTARATLTLNITYSPIAMTGESRIVGWVGDLPEVRMRFHAFPSPRVTCSHNNHSSVSEDYWKMMIENKDEVTDVTIQIFPKLTNASVYGIYECTATNREGKTTASVELVKGRAPEPPEVTVTNSRPSWVLLEIRLPTDMGLPHADKIIARYQDLSGAGEVVEFDKAVPVDANNTAQNWNITGLHPGRTYRITLQLSNAVAQSNETVITTALPQHSPPDPVHFITEPQGEYPRIYILKWHPPVTHGAPVTEYSLSYVPVTLEKGAGGRRIVRLAGIENHVTVQKSAKTLVISGLQENTHYRVTMTAHSEAGSSLPATFIFTTRNNTESNSQRQHSWDRTSIYYPRLPLGDPKDTHVLMGTEAGKPDLDSQSTRNSGRGRHIGNLPVLWLLASLAMFLALQHRDFHVDVRNL